MNITYNGQPLTVAEGTLASQVLKEQLIPNDSLCLLNGFAFDSDPILKEGDTLLFVPAHNEPTESQYDALWTARYGPTIYKRLKESHIIICGAGGLGSHIAMSLTRLGIGKLTIIDKDVVDLTNLGRQAYEMSDLGKPKVDALKAILLRINPFIKINALHTTINTANYDEYLHDAPYIMEAFDSPENKAELTNYVMTHYPKSILIGANGVSGYDHPNTVKTKQIFSNYFQTGDGHSESSLGLLAPRVMLCAAHQATMLLHLLLTT